MAFRPEQFYTLGLLLEGGTPSFSSARSTTIEGSHPCGFLIGPNQEAKRQ